MKVYDYYDKLACTFSGNFGLFQNDGAAIRTYKTLYNSQKLPPLVISNPDDYAIYCLGEFNQETGDIVPDKKLVVHFVDLMVVKDNG